MDNHDTTDEHKTTDGFPIENCMLGASEMQTFRVPDNGQNRIPTIATHTKSASLNVHSLTHIKIYYSSDNFKMNLLFRVHRGGR